MFDPDYLAPLAAGIRTATLTLPSTRRILRKRRAPGYGHHAITSALLLLAQRLLRRPGQPAQYSFKSPAVAVTQGLFP